MKKEKTFASNDEQNRSSFFEIDLSKQPEAPGPLRYHRNSGITKKNEASLDKNRPSTTTGGSSTSSTSSWDNLLDHDPSESWRDKSMHETVAKDRIVGSGESSSGPQRVAQTNDCSTIHHSENQSNDSDRWSLEISTPTTKSPTTPVKGLVMDVFLSKANHLIEGDNSDDDDETLKGGNIYDGFEERKALGLWDDDDASCYQKQSRRSKSTDPKHQQRQHQKERDPSNQPPGFLRMRYLKQRKEARLMRQKETRTEPPPGFYRMMERKRQKELAIVQKKEEQEQLAEASSSSVCSSSSNRRSKASRARRKKRSRKKKRRTRPEGIYINGKIEGTIPEDVSICLGSPSHNERVRKFREMFHEQERMASLAKMLVF